MQAALKLSFKVKLIYGLLTRVLLVFQVKNRFDLHIQSLVATYRGPSIYHHYCIYFPVSSSWSRVDGVGSSGAPTTTFYGDLQGQNYLSVAVLPSPSVDILNIYR